MHDRVSKRSKSRCASERGSGAACRAPMPHRIMGRPKGSSAGSRWLCEARHVPWNAAYPRAGLPSRVCPKTSRQLTTAPTLEHRTYPGASGLSGTTYPTPTLERPAYPAPTLERRPPAGEQKSEILRGTEPSLSDLPVLSR